MSVIAELRVSADQFVLGEAMRRNPGMTLDLERFVPSESGLMPFMWATGDGYETLRDAIVDDPTVEEVTLLDKLDGGGLFEVTWGETDSALLGGFHDGDEAMLRAVGRDDSWFVKIRFSTREALSGFQAHCNERDISFELLRLGDTEAPKLGQYDLTYRQRNALVTALELGYFEVPRRAKLKDVAEELGLSPNAVSERIRRGEANLFRSALTVERPAGMEGQGSLLE